MFDEISILLNEVKDRISSISNLKEVEEFRTYYLSKKGKIQLLFDKLNTLSKEQKPLFGKELNELRKFAEENYQLLKDKYGSQKESKSTYDLTLPGRKMSVGSSHPVLQTMNKMIDIFVDMGFTVADGPEIEDEYHNFDALNFPKDHPARDMQDTFFMKNGENLLLRTHTSPVQIRAMQGMKPPIRSIMPGRVYRNEAINIRSLAEFHQIEGLYIDKNVSLAELKATLITFAQKMYGKDIKYRFRPSFFPFTEPSAEMDITCFLCGGKGCRVCKNSGWLEIVGCGMVHPNVLKSGGIDPDIYSGYAFGFGIERVTLLRTGVDDIRYLYYNDVRFLNQF
ncbi:MAG TPA: phenylalanine--tRNA ligase subunit alpha [Bacteroidetes bacterium]|jgi:phenylalanyl-tRNA synthetase alpha chain|nr:phenylalanine--tRNA ligase subunit alpha [bacterium]HAW08273.1 phenylalanine--tRNA ligase subunit alpha [Bacteroidota bacterium]